MKHGKDCGLLQPYGGVLCKLCKIKNNIDKLGIGKDLLQRFLSEGHGRKDSDLIDIISESYILGYDKAIEDNDK